MSASSATGQTYTAELVAFLSELDNGPLECLLGFATANSPDDGHKLLAFRDDLSDRAAALQHLLVQHDKLLQAHPAKARALQARSVANFIMTTNKLEFVGTETVGDTMAVLAGRPPSSTTEEQRTATLNTYKLLVETYSDKTVYYQIPDKMSLLSWHGKLCPDMPQAGKLRKVGAKSNKLDGGEHRFPHHDSVPPLVTKLCTAVWRIASIICPGGSYVDEDPVQRLTSVFALAAFLQFHFVDIHPFEDGNGRMCRFLSKRILDAVLPFPCPMFSDRTQYLSTLERCRAVGAEDARNAPLPLAELLFDEAINMYRALVREAKDYADGVVAGSTREEFMAAVAELDEQLQNPVSELWDRLVLNEEQRVNVAGKVIRVIRFSE